MGKYDSEMGVFFDFDWDVADNFAGSVKNILKRLHRLITEIYYFEGS